MKKALVLLALLAVSLTAQAQRVTAPNLQGSWLLESMNDGYVILYPEERRGVLTETGKEGLSAAEIEEEEALLATDAAEYADTVITFNGNAVRSVTEGEETMTGTFTLNAEGTVMTITDEGGDAEAEVSFVDQKLKLYAYDDEVTYIFRKMP